MYLLVKCGFTFVIFQQCSICIEFYGVFRLTWKDKCFWRPNRQLSNDSGNRIDHLSCSWALFATAPTTLGPRLGCPLEKLRISRRWTKKRCKLKYLIIFFINYIIKVSKYLNQMIMSLIFPKKRTKLNPGYYLECVLFVFWKNPGLHNLHSRFTVL